MVAGVLALLLAAALAVPAPAAGGDRLRVLVTGDSMVQPLDGQLDRHFTRRGARVMRDARPGTGISKPLLLDWVRHAARQTKRKRPDAAVVFIGAADREPLRSWEGPEVECCGRSWMDAYATRAAQMMRAYLRRPAAHLYWVILPTPRERSWQRRFLAVNLAFAQAAQQVGPRVRLLDTNPLLAPDGRYRHRLPYRGRKRVVRQRDGIHLSPAGSHMVLRLVARRMRADGLSP